MSAQSNPLFWSLNLGTWGGIRFRVSWLQPVVWLWLWLLFNDIVMGTTVFLILFLSVLLHEIGHVVAARRTGGSADEIVLWPIGGLAAVHYGPTPNSKILTAAAGPFVNLMLLLACLPYTLVWAAKPANPAVPVVTTAIDVLPKDNEQAGSTGANVSTGSTGSTVATGPSNTSVPTTIEGVATHDTTRADSTVAPVRRPSPWNPLVLPLSKLSPDWPGDLQVIAFSLNWMLFLLNLLPITLLDGYNIARGGGEAKSGRAVAAEVMPRVGLIAAVAMVVLSSLFLKSTAITGLFAFLGMVAAIEFARPNWQETGDDSFLGYDFSEGYTSLDRSGEFDDDDEDRRSAGAAGKSPGLWQKWKENREAERERREQEQFERDQTKLDDLLAKVHERGMSGLSEAEKRELKQLSERLRSRGKTA